jgi:hypothetical protein
MRRLILYGVLVLSVLACKKDKDERQRSEKDYSLFLAQTQPEFQGKLNENPFSWKFAWGQFQKSGVYAPLPNSQDTSELVRMVASGLISPGANLRWSMLHTPRYNSGSESEIAKVFSIGKKNLGEYISDYHLELFTNGVLYKSRGFEAKNEVEILKTSELLMI